MSPKENASKSPTIEELEAQITDFTRQQAACQARAKELMAREDPARGIYHHEEIFQLKQDALRLATEIMFRKNKIAKLRFEQ